MVTLGGFSGDRGQAFPCDGFPLCFSDRRSVQSYTTACDVARQTWGANMRQTDHASVHNMQSLASVHVCSHTTTELDSYQVNSVTQTCVFFFLSAGLMRCDVMQNRRAPLSKDRCNLGFLYRATVNQPASAERTSTGLMF